MFYIMPADLYNSISHLDGFRNTYGGDYNQYIIKSISPSLILKELILISDSPEDTLGVLKYFDIDYTHNYLDLFTSKDTLTTNISLIIR